MKSDYEKKIINRDYDPKLITTVDDFFSYTQDTGSVLQSGSNTLRGFNQTSASAPLPVNKDAQGLVFFTRPMLNLSTYNISRHSTFQSLSNTNAASVQRYVRCMLDPSLHNYGNPNITTPLVDNQHAFIPLLSNAISKLSGWPDIVLPTFTSKQGTRKEQWSMGDGTIEVNESFSLDATFTNMADEPVSLLFKTWVDYISYVFDGQLKPYLGFEARNELDYTTRIYRLVLDKTQTYVKKIACTIASFPVNEPTGKFFDYDSEQVYSNQTKEINTRFMCMGARYNDEVIVKWFNTTSMYANNALRDVVASDFKPSNLHTYVKIPGELFSLFKYHGYPLINTNTFELEWWLDSNSTVYKQCVSNRDAFFNNKTIGV